MKDNSFYLYLQKRLLESVDGDNILHCKQAESILVNIRISKSYIPILIKELNNLGLIKKVNRDKIEVINSKKSQNITVDWKYGKRVVRCESNSFSKGI